MQGRNTQIKSKQRVQQHGEVFTAEREVTAMLDLVGPYITEITTTVLEPAVGEGVFLVNILKRKLETISCYGMSGLLLEWTVLRAVSTLYGVDIQKDNVLITRENLRTVLRSFFEDQSNECSHHLDKAIDTILSCNIVCGNTLTAQTSMGKELKFPEWTFASDWTIERRDYSLTEILESGGDCKRNRRKKTYYWLAENAGVSMAAHHLSPVLQE